MNGDLLLFWAALGLYGAATVAYGGFLGSKRAQLAQIAAGFLSVGFVALTVSLIVRWHLDGHLPIASMHEYLRFLTWTISLVYLGLVVLKMRNAYVGAFVGPLAFLILLLAAIFPKEIERQLVPALQSYWLKIHVTAVVFGTGAFATSFSAGLLYLFRAYRPEATAAAFRRQITMLALVATGLGLAIAAAIFIGTGYSAPDALFLVTAVAGLAWLFALPLFWILVWVRVGQKDSTGLGGHIFAVSTLAFVLGAVVTALLRGIPSLGFLHAPEKKTIFLPFLGSMALFGVLVTYPLQRFVVRIRGVLPSEDLLDEVGYRSASIGYPIFGLGVGFGAAWAYSAWGRAWGFDPKEVGALIVFLVYSVYMHARRARDWRGTKTAVVAMLGFLCSLFTLFGNTSLGGLHSYAG